MPTKTSFSQELQDVLSRQVKRIEARKHVLRIPRAGDAYLADDHWHFHPTAELFIQVSGISRMQFSDETIRCLPNQILLIPKGISHHEEVLERKGKFKNIVVAFGRQTISLHESGPGTENDPKIFRLEQIASDNVADLCGYLDAIVEWKHRKLQLRDTAMRGLLLAFFSLLLFNLQSLSSQRRKESFKVLHCRQMVSEHLSNPDLSVQWLAGRIPCAPDYLSYRFHEETGDKLTQYINDKRIALARNLLAVSSLNVSEVAQACGYSDPGYMTRQFRQHVGCAPRAYRRSVRPTDGGSTTDQWYSTEKS